jgi:UrcA family protein
MIKTTIAITALLFASSAFADQFRFSYTEADFSSPDAVAALHKRIQTSARSYCNREYFTDRSLREVQACVSDVTGQMVDGIGDRRLAGHIEQTDRRDS